MAYSAPPTFADGAILIASQLNILSDDIEYLYGLARGYNIPFARVQNLNGINLTTDVDAAYKMRHRTQYLIVKGVFLMAIGAIADFEWRVDVQKDGGTINTDADSVTWTQVLYEDDTEHAFTRSIDIDALAFPPSANDWYEISIRWTYVVSGVQGNNRVTLKAIYESDTSEAIEP